MSEDPPSEEGGAHDSKHSQNAGPTHSRGLWDGLSIIFKSRVATIGLTIVVLWVLIAIFAPLIAPHSPTFQDSKAINQGPSAKYLLGTDKLGRDVLSRLIFGSRTILLLAPIVGAGGGRGRYVPGIVGRLFRRNG